MFVDHVTQNIVSMACTYLRIILLESSKGMSLHLTNWHVMKREDPFLKLLIYFRIFSVIFPRKGQNPSIVQSGMTLV